MFNKRLHITHLCRKLLLLKLKTTSAFAMCTLVVFSFLLLACSEQATEPSLDDEASSSQNQSLQSAQNNATTYNEPALLTLTEILNASDVKAGLALAAKNKDISSLQNWQNLLLQAADEVNLAEQERRLIEGEQGLSYLEYEGMKTNYQTDFEQAFFHFEDIDMVYQNYPAFKNLHQRSKALVEKRDALISAVEKELRAQNFDGDSLAEARRQWQTFVKSQSVSPKTNQQEQTQVTGN